MTKDKSSPRPNTSLGDILKEFEGNDPGPPGVGRMYFIVTGSEAAGLDGQWSNPPADFLLRAPGSKLRSGLDDPKIDLNGAPGSLLADVFSTLGGVWIVSARTRDLLEQVDGQAFAFTPATMTFRDGSNAPQYWLTDVVRTIDCIDLIRSGLGANHDADGAKRTLSVLGIGRIVFRSAVIADARVFRIATEPTTICCDATFRSAILNAGLRGLQFTPWGRADF